MSVVVELSIPPGELPAGDALAEAPEAHVELERVVPAGETALPYLWVLGDDADRFVERVREDPAIEDPTVLDRVEYGVLLRVTWIPDGTILDEIRAAEATILDATGTAEGWSFRVRTPDRDGLSTLIDGLEDYDVPVSIESIRGTARVRDQDSYGLTSCQESALLAAYEEGYFETPREVSQAELGERFDVTARAISDRIRRGTRNLVETTIRSPTPRRNGRSPD